jgi:hypothetical protein
MGRSPWAPHIYIMRKKTSDFSWNQKFHGHVHEIHLMDRNIKFLHIFLISLMHPLWQIQIIRLDPTTLKILCEEFKLWSSSMWNFLHYPIISFNLFHNDLGSKIFSSPRPPDRLWGPLLSKGYWGLFPRGLSGRGMKLTTHLQLVPRSRQCGSIYSLSQMP